MTTPSLLTSGDHRRRRPRHPRARHRARPGARSRGPCGTIHQVSTTSRHLALPVTDPALAARLRERMEEVEEALAGHVAEPVPFVTQAASHLLDAGGKRFRPLLVLLAAEAGAAARRRGRGHRRLRRGDHPPRLALPRRRDGRGRPAPRRRLGQRPLGQPGRDPHRRLPLRQVLRADRPAGRRRGADPGRDLHPPGRGPDPRDRRPGPRRGPAGALPRGRGRQDRLADRDLGPLRRPLRRRQRRRSRRR